MITTLKTTEEIKEATRILTEKGLSLCKACEPKNWDLSLVAKGQGDGDIIDVGCNGSLVLENHKKAGLVGSLYGIDLFEVETPGKFIHGNFLDTELPRSYFDFVSCISVVEHGVDMNLFAEKCDYVCKSKARIFLSFDYWQTRIDVGNLRPFGLPWCIFCESDVRYMKQKFAQYGFTVGNEDYSVRDTIIYPGYFSPGNVAYTFCFMELSRNY